MSKTLLERFIEQTAELKVAVIGETIIDEFVAVTYEGQSMKSFCPVFKLGDAEPEAQIGGTGAIANHLRGFVKSVDFITNENREIVKTRLVDTDGKKKHVEINKFDTKNFGAINIDVNAYDVVIVADFGHGFCNEINIGDGFHLMCQTNSNNFGFNRMSKWKTHRKKSIALDLREASLQINKRWRSCTDEQAKEIYDYEMNCDDLFVTLGGQGALYTNGNAIARHHSFKTNIVDTIGAGDTFFAFACIASHLNLASEEKLVIPSLAASLSTTWLCNEKSVTPETLRAHANQYL